MHHLFIIYLTGKLLGFVQDYMTTASAMQGGKLGCSLCTEDKPFQWNTEVAHFFCAFDKHKELQKFST